MRLRCGQAAVLLFLLAACGKSQEAKAFDRLKGECNGLVEQGATIASAQQVMNPYAADLVGVDQECRADYVAVEQCPAATAAAPICSSKYVFLPNDTAACGGGACICELRYTQADFQAQGGNAPLCASRFFTGQ